MNVRELLRQIVRGTPDEAHTAQEALYRLDEDAIDALCDEFYSGVDEATGIVILKIASAIGGPDALRLLKYAAYFGDKAAWRAEGLRGLSENGSSELDSSS